MPTRPFRWGILGTASIAERFVASVAGLQGVEVVAIASRDAARANAWGERHGVPLRFGSYDALMASGAVDAVYVALPNSLHREWSVRAIEAGVPVLCEKPIAVDAAEARLVAERSAARGVPVMEAFMYRFHPHAETLFELARSGAVGDLRSVDAVFTFPLDDPASIVASAALGGGALLDVGCYAVDALLALADAAPVRAHAVAVGGDVDHRIAGVVQFDNGVLGRLEASIDSAERHWLAVTGTEGTIVSRTPWVHGADPTVIHVQRHGEADRVVDVASADAVARMVSHFVDVVRGAARPRISIEDSVRTMELLDVFAASAGTRRSGVV